MESKNKSALEGPYQESLGIHASTSHLDGPFFCVKEI